MAEKARDAFRTISEVANWLDVPAHVLRFWESKFTQIKPVKRAGGRRYYRPDDMRLIGGIKQLLHDDGLTIRGVQKMLKEEGVKHVSGLSPEIDMPSEQEGAARREARRARRQTRQSSQADTAPAAVEPVAEPQLGAEDTETVALDDAIAAEVAAAPPVQSDPGDITASLTDADDAPAAFEPAPAAPSDDVAMPDEPVAESPGAAQTDAMASDAQDPPPASAEPNFFAEEAAPQDVTEADPQARAGDDTPPPNTPETPDTPEAQTDVSAPVPDPTPAPDATPTVDIPADPALDSIHASPAQRQHAATLRALRSRVETHEIPPQHHVTLRSALERMQALHDRMSADGARS